MCCYGDSTFCLQSVWIWYPFGDFTFSTHDLKRGDMISQCYCKSCSISSQSTGSIPAALRNNHGTEGVFMIRHFNASHPFKAYLMLTLFFPSLASTNVARRTSNTNPLNEHFREGALCTLLKVKKVVAESANLR